MAFIEHDYGILERYRSLETEILLDDVVIGNNSNVTGLNLGFHQVVRAETVNLAKLNIVGGTEHDVAIVLDQGIGQPLESFVHLAGNFMLEVGNFILILDGLRFSPDSFELLLRLEVRIEGTAHCLVANVFDVATHLTYLKCGC